MTKRDYDTLDSAFGALACLLPEYRFLSGEMALADSLTSDGLCKCLTVRHALIVRGAHRPQVVQRSVCIRRILHSFSCASQLRVRAFPTPSTSSLSYSGPLRCPRWTAYVFSRGSVIAFAHQSGELSSLHCASLVRNASLLGKERVCGACRTQCAIRSGRRGMDEHGRMRTDVV